jgi:hypothetical protein
MGYFSFALNGVLSDRVIATARDLGAVIGTREANGVQSIPVCLTNLASPRIMAQGRECNSDRPLTKGEWDSLSKGFGLGLKNGAGR